MPTYVYRNGKVIDKELAGPKHSSSSAPYAITDEMAATRHMADGKYYTSKHKFREATKAHGCIEVGNELKTLTQPRRPKSLDRQQRVNDIRRAIEYLKSR